MSNHSALPWKHHASDVRDVLNEDDFGDCRIFFLSGTNSTPDIDKANAELIVKSVNAYPRLVQVMREYLGTGGKTQELFQMSDLLRELGEI